MKILQVFPHPYSKEIVGGGILEYVRNVSERLAKRNDVTVFATGFGDFPRFEVINGVKVERFSCIAPSRAYFFSLEMILRMWKARFDVVHAHCYQAFPAHFSFLANSKKLVLSPHYHGVGHSVFRNSIIRLSRIFGLHVLKKADVVIAVSEFEKSLLCEQFGLSSDKVVVIPCGINFGEFASAPRRKSSEGFKSVLYVGRLREYKGVKLLVEVLPLLSNDVVLEIVGDGPLRPVLEKRAKDLGVLDRVKFHKNLSRAELVKKYKTADVFVLLSQFEAYSMVVAEALYSGTPCIVADTSALSEWIDNRICFGIKYPVNLHSLASLINSVIGLRLKKGRFAFSHDKLRDWEDVVSQIESVYIS